METSFLDMSPCSRSNGIPTPARCSGNEPQTAGFPACTCTKEIYGCSIHPTGPAEWIASMRDSLARIFQSPELAQALKASVAAFGEKWSGSLASYDHASSSWRIPQLSLLGGWEPYSETWPAWGTMQDGACWELPPLVPRTYVLDGGALHGVPTPLAGDGKKGGPNNRGGKGDLRLPAFAAIYPTPTASNYGSCQGGSVGRSGQKNRPSLETMARKHLWPTPLCSEGSGGWQPPESGKLNPTWVEWLMGWPLGYSASKHWAMAKSRSKQRRPT